MESEHVYKKFTALESDVDCMCKNVTWPFESTKTFHNHDGYEILILLNGELDYYTEYGGVTMKRGDVMFTSTYEFHRAELQTPDVYDRIVINVKDNVLKAGSDETFDLEACLTDDDIRTLKTTHLKESELEIIDNYAHQLEKCINRRAPGDNILIDSYLKIIMIMLNKISNKRGNVVSPDIMPDIVVKTLKYIEEHLAEDVSLETLETLFHYNGAYISRKLKEIMGITFQQYLLAKRLAQACKLLREGKAPSYACFMSGFNNYSNFSRTFTKQIGKSPKQYQIDNR